MAEDWTVPAKGNHFFNPPLHQSRGDDVLISDANKTCSLYFWVSEPATLEISLNASVPKGKSTLVVQVGNSKFQANLSGSNDTDYPLGSVEIAEAGYVHVEIRGLKKTGNVFAKLNELRIKSSTEGLELAYVQNNDDGMFYWGRRGPSVHLNYPLPESVDITYAYSEITVPEGEDPIGTYYMANGFGEGYFGFQVNSETERRVLFSVWSPFQTDNPRDIPPEMQIRNVARGKGVHIGEFGNEGSGGQSYLKYPWKAGKTYRFLTKIVPNGDETTTYTSWFGDKEADEWRLIASFVRPKTNTHYKHFHSFLENFSAATGHIGRQAQYGNTWVCDTQGKWHECNQARFSVDNTGRKRQRLDFTGGVQGNRFYLENCGFINNTGTPGETFTRESTADSIPQIDFDLLPME
ncbi:DUF3472 domain-containing protein [Planctomicrobium sp. SH668]|uniref:DUF3472 domain-containing protein n=1 Tax=Planctomicrobium sp. SH668 TaxID=3448126 RepID=UPI003F5AE86D